MSRAHEKEMKRVEDALARLGIPNPHTLDPQQLTTLDLAIVSGITAIDNLLDGDNPLTTRQVRSLANLLDAVLFVEDSAHGVESVRIA